MARVLSALFLAALLAAPPPAHARNLDLDLADSSFVALEAGSGIYFDLPAAAGGTVFIPLVAQTGGGSTPLRAALGGRIRVDFRPDEQTPTLAIVGRRTLVTPVASGSWLPGLPTTEATPAAAQAAALFGTATSLPAGIAALRELALTIDESHPLVATSASTWSWPDGPFTGPGADTLELAVADGVIDFDASLTPKTRLLVTEGAKTALSLSAANRARVRTWADGEQLELRIPIDVSFESTAADIHSNLPVRVRLELGGEIVARNFVPEPGGAAAAAAALAALLLLARRGRRSATAHRLAEIAALGLLIGAACSDPEEEVTNDPEANIGAADLDHADASLTLEGTDRAFTCDDANALTPCDESFETAAVDTVLGQVSVRIGGAEILATISNAGPDPIAASATIDTSASFTVSSQTVGDNALQLRLLCTPQGAGPVLSDATAAVSFPDSPSTAPTTIPADGRWHTVDSPIGGDPFFYPVEVQIHGELSAVPECPEGEEFCFELPGPWGAAFVYTLDYRPTERGCDHDAQCTGSANCVAGHCVFAGECLHPLDCPGGRICTEHGCDPPSRTGAHCDADGDCASGECTETEICEACADPNDEDCDGLSDVTDPCPDHPDGTCTRQLLFPTGIEIFCFGDEDCANLPPSGGTCTRCGVRHLGVDLDCSAGGTCTARHPADVSCDGCRATTDAGSSVQCDGSCSTADGHLRCSGAAGECAGNLVGVGPVSCGTRPCELYDWDEYSEEFPSLEPRGVVIFTKETTPESGDGAFRFQLGPDPSTFLQPTIQTANHVGEKDVVFVAPLPKLSVEELQQALWELLNLRCDGLFLITGFRSILATPEDPLQPVRCEFLNYQIDTFIVPSIDAVETVQATALPGEAASLARAPAANHWVLAAGNGWEVIDPLSGAIANPSWYDIPLSFAGPSNLLGVLFLPIEANPARFDVFTWGPNGTTRGELDASFTQVDSSNVQDAIFAGGDATQASVVMVQNGEINTFGGPLVENFELIGYGARRSVWAEYPIDHVLIATEGATAGTNGKLLRADPDLFNQEVVVGDLGVAPRRLRCLSGVCVITNQGSDTATIATWDGGANAAVTATATTGDGPIGVALRQGGANVIAATANYDGASYTLLVLAPDGSVLASATTPVPEGCLGPGGASWLGDPENHLVLSCRESDALAVFVPEIPAP